jgi:hypothetical protein
MSGDKYIAIPSDESFVKALHTEVGLIDAGRLTVVNENWYCSDAESFVVVCLNMPHLGRIYGCALAGHSVYLANYLQL